MWEVAFKEESSVMDSVNMFHIETEYIYLCYVWLVITFVYVT